METTLYYLTTSIGVVIPKVYYHQLGYSSVVPGYEPKYLTTVIMEGWGKKQKSWSLEKSKLMESLPWDGNGSPYPKY